MKGMGSKHWGVGGEEQDPSCDEGPEGKGVAGVEQEEQAAVDGYTARWSEDGLQEYAALWKELGVAGEE